MSPAGCQPLRVAIGCNSEQQRMFLHQLLEGHGLRVATATMIDDASLLTLDRNRADVLLVDMDDECDAAVLDRLMEQVRVPVLFNDSGQNNLAQLSSSWPAKLVEKITSVAARDELVAEVSQPPEIAVTLASSGSYVEHAWEGAAPSSVAPQEQGAARTVWVLGASAGGPNAVKQFLAALPRHTPVSFILAQHIGRNFLLPLARQLDSTGPFHVMPARHELLLREQQVVLAPVEECLVISDGGRIDLRPDNEQRPYKPSIDQIMAEVARNYGDRSGAIIFSGMGQDGARGCKVMAASGGVIWAQDAESCLISSMPEHARATGMVSLSGSPEVLARKLAERLGNPEGNGA